MKILEPFGYTPEHTAAVADMDKNFTGSQFDYAAAATKDMVDRASNPLTATISAVGNVVGRPFYDIADAVGKYSDKGYQGEFSFSPQGAVDFLGNLKSLGGEFLAQKPHTMMAGALKGGIESLGTQLGEGVYDYIYGPQMRFKQQQFMNKKKQDMQRQIREAEKKQRQIREAEEKRIEQEKIKTAQDNWKPTYNPASSHAEAQATGDDYHGGHQSTVDGQTTDWGPNSAMIARGGLAQYAPRGSYFNGGLASLYRHGRF